MLQRSAWLVLFFYNKQFWNMHVDFILLLYTNYPWFSLNEKIPNTSSGLADFTPGPATLPVSTDTFWACAHSRSPVLFMQGCNALHTQKYPKKQKTGNSQYKAQLSSKFWPWTHILRIFQSCFQREVWKPLDVLTCLSFFGRREREQVVSHLAPLCKTSQGLQPHSHHDDPPPMSCLWCTLPPEEPITEKPRLTPIPNLQTGPNSISDQHRRGQSPTRWGTPYSLKWNLLRVRT